MWTPGMGELVILLVIVLVIFGPGKLPKVGKSLGSAISEFKDSVRKKEETVDTEQKSETTTNDAE